MSSCNSSVYRWEKHHVLYSASIYIFSSLRSFSKYWLSVAQFPTSFSVSAQLSPSHHHSTSLLPGVFILLFSFYPLALHFIYDSLSALLECWPAPGARTLPVWGLALEWLCWEGTVPGMALPSVFSVTCINWMLSLLGLASASCYFSHIICRSLMFFSMFWEIFYF